MALVYIQHCQLCKVAWMKYTTAVTTQKSEVRIKINHPHYKAIQACLRFRAYFAAAYFEVLKSTLKNLLLKNVCTIQSHYKTPNFGWFICVMNML